MTTGNPVEEGILKLIEKGYKVNDVYNIMTQIGWQPDDVRLSMNEIYERRAKENEAIAKQRQDAIDKVNASYEDLKKKAEPQQSDSFFGTFPGESSVELNALDELDSQVLNSVAKSNTLESMNRGVSNLMKNIEALNSLKASISDPKLASDERRAMEKQIVNLENQIQSGYDKTRNDFGQALNMGVNLDWDMDLNLDQDEINIDPYRDFIVRSHMAERKESDAIRTLGKNASSTYKEFMGVDFPDVESIGDLNDQLITMSFNRGLDRAKMEEESYGDPYDAYEMEEYEKSLEDQSMVGSMGRQFGSMLGSMFAGSTQFVLDLGEFVNENPYLRFISPHLANLGFAEQLAEGINRRTGFDTKEELLHYKRRLREKDAVRSRARDKELWNNPMFWGKGMTERDEIIFQQLESGDIDATDAMELFALNLYQGLENVLPSATYYGGLSMMGPGGLLALAGSAGSTTYGDLNIDRPDLSIGEKALIAGTVGSVEATLAKFFRGAEKLLMKPAMQMFAPAAIREMGKKAVRQGAAKKFFQGSALGSVLGEGAEEAVAYLAELGITNAVDAVAGRKTEGINKYELIDQFQAGMLGGGAFVGAGSVVRSVANRGHHQTRNRKLFLQQRTNELRNQINSMPIGPERQELRKQLYNLNKEYRDLSAQETLTYGYYSAQDRARIAKLNREIAHVEDMIKYKKDSAGIGLNKDQLEALEVRLKGAMDAKIAIESKYDSVEKAAAKNAKKETEPSQDVEGKDVPVESTTVASEDVKEEQKDVPLAENTDPVKQEGEKLSSFNEKDFAEKDVDEAPIEEAPVTEQSETEDEATAEEAPVAEEAPADIYSTSNEVSVDKGFDLADREKVGDNEDQVSIAAASAFNRALKGFSSLIKKAESKIYVVSRSDFDAIAESRNPKRFREIKDAGNRIGGYYDVRKNAIVLPSDARITSIQEEFGHAFMLPLINGQANPELQQELFNDLINGVDSRLKGKASAKFKAWKKGRDAKYKDQSTLKYREEMILGFFKHYKENVSDFKGIIGYIKQAIHKILKKANHKGPLPFREDSKLLQLAEAYANMAEGVEADLDVTKEDFQEAQERAKVRIDPEEVKKRPEETDEQHAARMQEIVTRATQIPSPEDVSRQEADDNQAAQEDPPGIDDLYSVEGRKKFTYLKDTEVFYEEDPYAEIGAVYLGEKRRLKKAKFKDYFHFRNWYNHMTANQMRPRIGKMYFVKDGKKYEVKPPKRKVDKDGKPVLMRGAESGKVTQAKQYYRRQGERAAEFNEARDEVIEFLGDATEEMRRAGVDSANGAAFFPGFDYDTFSGLEGDERAVFRSNFLNSKVFNGTPQEIRELRDIARKNLQTLKENGMSPEEMAAADKASLFNSLGLKKESDTVDGDTMDGGDIMYSIESQDDLDSMKFKDRQGPVQRFRSKLAERGIQLPQLVRISEYNGARAIVIGYDPSFLNIETGIQNQVGQKIDGQPVYTSHRDRAMAQKVLKVLKEQAIADNKRPKAERKGYVVVLTGALSKESLLGNPTVYKKAWAQALEGLEGEARTQRANEIISKLNNRDLRAILNQPGIDIVYSENSSLSDKIDDYRSDPKSRSFPQLNDAEVDEFLKLTTFVDANETNLSFERRNRLTKRVLLESGITSKLTAGAVEWAEKNFFDETLEDFDLGTVFAATKIPYVIKGGQVRGMRIRSTGGAFGAAIIRDPDVSLQEVRDKDGNVIKEGIGDSEGTQWLRTPVRVSAAIPGARKVLYKTEGKRRKAVKDPKTGKEKLVKAFRKSLNESQVRAEEADVLAKSRGRGTIKVSKQDDFLSIEGDMMSVDTDQGTFEMPNLTGFQKWRNLWIRRLVDKYNDIFDIQAAIEAQKGKVSQSMDFKMKEELMYGKAAEDLLKLDRNIEDIKMVLKEEGLALDTLNDYLYALHAKERNRVIKERIEADNEKRAEQKKKLLPVTDSGSGMSDADADAILSRIKPSQKKGLDKIEKMVRDIQNDTRETMVEFGLEKQETIDAWNEMFDRYVPLAGIAQDENSEATSSYPTGGAGLSVFGPMTKRAKGRKTEAENVLAQVIAQNAATHVKARTNEAVRSLYDLANQNPNADIWQTLDEANSLDPHVVSVRVDGEQKFIRFKDASYAQTLRNMNLPETNLFLKILRAPSNWLRRSFTTLNPEFVVSNFARDIQTAVFNAAAESEIDGGLMNGEKVMGEIIKTVPKALKSLLRGQVGLDQDPEMKRYYEEFREDGAKTGWAYAKRLNEIAADLERTAGDTTRTQEILGVGKNMIDFVEGVNESFEDATRLASYIAARRNGVSREKAAQLAKNITVNFNKHGEWGQALNGVYLFFNASVQGTSRMLRTIGKVKPATRPDGTTRQWNERATTAQKMAAGLTLFSSMLSMINAGLSGEDEDDVLFYDKIPDYVKERNLIVMNPRDGKTYYKIPLPYGFNIFSNIGTVSADVARGGMKPDEGIFFLASGLVNAFSPISFGQSESLGRALAKGGIPTVAKPLFDAWGFNETYFGGPVAAEQLPFGTKRPESTMSFRSPESVKSFFTWMNEATGGSDRVSGSIDINPDRMWYVFEYFIGGAGNFVNRTGKTIKSVGGKFKDSDYDISVNDIPFLRIMYGEQSRYYDHGKYRDNETKIKQLHLERKDTRDWNNPRYEGVLELNNKLKITEKKLKKLREDRRKAREIKDWTRRSVEVQKIMDQERVIIMEFNKRYNELREK